MNTATLSSPRSTLNPPAAVCLPTWFDSPERRQLLLQTASAWKGTPFFANSEAIGRDGGVDCAHLQLAIFAACGVIEHFKIPRQVMDHGQHSKTSLLIEAFEQWPQLRLRFRRLPDCSPANILPGDSLCFLAGHVPHHGAIMVTRTDVLHVLGPCGVHFMQLAAVIRGESILGRLEAVFRPLPDALDA